MADPLEVLRSPITAAQPTAAFAGRLRRQLERALALPRGVAMIAVAETETISQDQADQPDQPGPQAVTPYLAVRDARAAIEWYRDVFGATLIEDPIVMPDGRIGHVELAMGAAVVYLADKHRDLGVVAPVPGAAAVSLMLNVEDADETRARAVRAGADGRREPYDGHGARHAWIVDPFGHRWGLQSALRPTAGTEISPDEPRPGDIGYVSVWVPDVEVAARFYADVLGWTYAPAHRPDGRRVETSSGPSIGLHVSQDPPTLYCCYAVADIQAAVAAVRAAGGQADEPTVEPFGPAATCVDDQGGPFALYEPAGARGPQAERDGEQSGARYGAASVLSYLTMAVVDSARARAFYGAVLGWSFTPGRAAEHDGWAVHEPAPMVGLGGGHERAAGIPMWRVDDISAAVLRVRAAGGRADEPTQQAYGLMAECVDNQGSQFYLGELP